MKNKKEAEKEEKEGKGEHIHVCLTARRGEEKNLGLGHWQLLLE